MELEDSYNGGRRAAEGSCYGEPLGPLHPEDVLSTGSTPYASAPSSPGRGGYFFSAPASPRHFVLSSSPCSFTGAPRAGPDASALGPFEFEFSSRSSGADGAMATGSMSSADELFLDGQIRPIRLSSHLQRPRTLAPLLDLEGEEEVAEAAAIRGRDPSLRSRSMNRRARSMSPLWNTPLLWPDEEGGEKRWDRIAAAGERKDGNPDLKQVEGAAPSVSASSSRSSSTSSSRSGKRWVFLKDLLYRSKSEGGANAKEKLWHAVGFSPSKEKNSSIFFWDVRSKDSTKSPPVKVASPASLQNQRQKDVQPPLSPSAAADGTKTASSASSRPASKVGRRRVTTPSPHERHYTANRAQAEEMRKKSFLPYRQGLLGCLWFNSRSYGTMDGLTRTLKPVSSS